MIVAIILICLLEIGQTFVSSSAMLHCCQLLRIVCGRSLFGDLFDSFALDVGRLVLCLTHINISRSRFFFLNDIACEDLSKMTTPALEESCKNSTEQGREEVCARVATNLLQQYFVEIALVGRVVVLSISSLHDALEEGLNKADGWVDAAAGHAADHIDYAV